MKCHYCCCFYKLLNNSLFDSGVLAAIKSTFNKMRCDDWEQKLVALGADGAAVNMEKKGGVAAKLQEKAGKYIVPFHCMPHR